MKKSAAETHRMLSNTYEAAISERTCHEWFQRFKNGDFDVVDRNSGGREKVFKDAELEALLEQESKSRRIGTIIGSDSKPFQNASKPWE